MGYDVHITRAESWAENEGYWISPEEWLRVVEEDEELRLDPHPSNGPYMAIWNGPSENPEPWFDWSDGNVFTKNPDAPLLAKMIELAGRLKAKVQGDDGEVYVHGENRKAISLYEKVYEAVLTEIQMKGWTPRREVLKPESWSIFLTFRRGFWARNFRLTFHGSTSALEVLKCPLFRSCTKLLTLHVHDAGELKKYWNNIVQVIECSLSE